MAAAKKKAKVKRKKAPARKPAIRKKLVLKKKAPARKPAKRAAPKKPAARPVPKPQPVVAPPPARPVPLPGEEPIGIVTHYYGHLSVAVVRLDTGTLKIGDTIRIIGHTSDFRQKVESLQIGHEAVSEVGRRQEFGMKVKEHARENDVVYRVPA